MSEYYDYDEAVRANEARRRKAARLRRKRKARIRLIKRNILRGIVLVVLTLLVVQFAKHIIPDIQSRRELKQNAVSADTGTYDDVITVVQEKPVFQYALKSVNYKEMADTDIQSPYVALLDVTNNEFIAGRQINTRIYPASMTKVMSLIVAVENIDDMNKTYKFGFDELNNLYVQQASVAGFSVDASVCSILTYMAHEIGIGMSTKNQIWGSDSNTFAWKGIPAMTLNRDGFGMHTRHDTIALLSDWSLERSAVLLGYIADRLGNIESFPFERKVPEEFIAQLNEYFG